MLPVNEKLRVEEILKDLEHYVPRERAGPGERNFPKARRSMASTTTRSPNL
nr:hypothetical protein [Mesotoga sp. HF07.pep.5.2.highcov]